GLRLEQRLLERLCSADVGFRRAAANRDADAHPGDVARRTGCDLRTHGSVLPNILGYDTKIEWKAALGHLDQFRRRAVANDDLVTGRALVQGGDLVQRAGYAAPCYDLKFSGLHSGTQGYNKN